MIYSLKQIMKSKKSNLKYIDLPCKRQIFTTEKRGNSVFEKTDKIFWENAKIGQERWNN